ncbi:MAG: hypothetical protein HYS71_00880, partial [Candidatus Omnitrophica bacterium]|nr:hypothetical protein [Candidatus Omnitrophota bacterium]
MRFDEDLVSDGEQAAQRVGQLEKADIVFITTEGLQSALLSEALASASAGLNQQARMFDVFRRAQFLFDEVDALKAQPDLQASLPGSGVTLAVFDKTYQVSGKVDRILEYIAEEFGPYAVAQYRAVVEGRAQWRTGSGLAGIVRTTKEISGGEAREKGESPEADPRRFRQIGQEDRFEVDLRHEDQTFQENFKESFFDWLKTAKGDRQAARSSKWEEFIQTEEGKQWNAALTQTAQALTAKQKVDFDVAGSGAEERLVPTHEASGAAQARQYWNDPYQAAAYYKVLGPSLLKRGVPASSKISLNPISKKVSMADVFREIDRGHLDIASRNPNLNLRVVGYSGTGADSSLLGQAYGFEMAGRLPQRTNLDRVRQENIRVDHSASASELMNHVRERLNGDQKPYIVNVTRWDAAEVEARFHEVFADRTRLIRDAEGRFWVHFRDGSRGEINAEEAQPFLLEDDAAVLIHRPGSRGLDLWTPAESRLIVLMDAQASETALNQALGRFRGVYEEKGGVWEANRARNQGSGGVGHAGDDQAARRGDLPAVGPLDGRRGAVDGRG